MSTISMQPFKHIFNLQEAIREFQDAVHEGKDLPVDVLYKLRDSADGMLSGMNSSPAVLPTVNINPPSAKDIAACQALQESFATATSVPASSEVPEPGEVNDIFAGFDLNDFRKPEAEHEDLGKLPKQCDIAYVDTDGVTKYLPCKVPPAFMSDVMIANTVRGTLDKAVWTQSSDYEVKVVDSNNHDSIITTVKIDN